MAAKYWAGQDALGRRFRMGGPDRPWITVVGIVGNVRHNGVTAEVKPKFYRALDQWHVSSGSPARNMTLVVRTRAIRWRSSRRSARAFEHSTRTFRSPRSGRWTM